jgi:hypothetical protein
VLAAAGYDAWLIPLEDETVEEYWAHEVAEEKPA